MTKRETLYIIQIQRCLLQTIYSIYIQCSKAVFRYNVLSTFLTFVKNFRNIFQVEQLIVPFFTFMYTTHSRICDTRMYK